MTWSDTTLLLLAQAVDKRRRQEKLENNDIPIGKGNDGNSNADSELSVLASSLFDGINGIEISSSIELGSDDDSTSALSIAFSPQKMRSGKVVKYRSEK